MAFTQILLSLLVVAQHAISGPLLEARQNAALLSGYQIQISSVRAAIDSIKVDNSTQACSDADYVTTLRTRGLDGQLAHTLVCEDAAGIQIFPDIHEALQILAVVAEGLERIKAGRVVGCIPKFDGSGIAILNNAGLDGAGILNMICTTPAEFSAISSAYGPTFTSSFGPVTSILAPSPVPDTKTLPPSSSVPRSGVQSGALQSSSILRSGTASGPDAITISVVPFTESSNPLPVASSSSSSNAAFQKSSSAPNNVTTVVVTTFVTRTITPTPSPSAPASSNGNANDSLATLPFLPPLRFTIESRVLPEQPAITGAVDSASFSGTHWTWTSGPPLSFSDPRQADGTSVAVSLVTNGAEAPMTCSDEPM